MSQSSHALSWLRNTRCTWGASTSTTNFACNPTRCNCAPGNACACGDVLRRLLTTFRHCRFQKYYKSLFLGLVDMALVNCYIIRNLVLKSKNQAPLDHYSFYKQLQAALIEISIEDFTECSVPSVRNPPRSEAVVRSTGHTLKQTTDERPRTPTPAAEATTPGVPAPSGLAATVSREAPADTPDGIKRTRFRVCKVCSIYRVSHSNCYRSRPEYVSSLLIAYRERDQKAGQRNGTVTHVP